MTTLKKPICRYNLYGRCNVFCERQHVPNVPTKEQSDIREYARRHQLCISYMLFGKCGHRKDERYSDTHLPYESVKILAGHPNRSSPNESDKVLRAVVKNQDKLLKIMTDKFKKVFSFFKIVDGSDNRTRLINRGSETTNKTPVIPVIQQVLTPSQQLKIKIEKLGYEKVISERNLATSGNVQNLGYEYIASQLQTIDVTYAHKCDEKSNGEIINRLRREKKLLEDTMMLSSEFVKFNTTRFHYIERNISEAMDNHLSTDDTKFNIEFIRALYQGSYWTKPLPSGTMTAKEYDKWIDCSQFHTMGPEGRPCGLYDYRTTPYLITRYIDTLTKLSYINFVKNKAIEQKCNNRKKGK